MVTIISIIIVVALYMMLGIAVVAVAFMLSLFLAIGCALAKRKILPDNAGEYVHWGATSQDIVDTGLILQMRQAYEVILEQTKVCQKSLLKQVKLVKSYL